MCRFDVGCHQNDIRVPVELALSHFDIETDDRV